MKEIRIPAAFFALALLVFAPLGCGSGVGGVEAGNPSQLVVGSLSPSAPCEADEVLATDSAGRTVTALIDDDCSFALNLPVPEAYQVDFLMTGGTLASLRFDNTSKRFPAPVMNLFPQHDTLFLDRITLQDGIASASREPSIQTDQDRDGVPDFFDEDDDADGIADEDEADCDLDGILNDFDAETPACSPNENGTVLEVFPRNGEGTATHGTRVKVTEDVKIHFSCPLDVLSAGISNLLIFPQNNPSDLLSCTLAVLASGNQLRCRHSDFAPDKIYEALLENLRCEDGSEIPSVSWTWRTR